MLVRDFMDSEIVTLRCETVLTEIYAVMLQYHQTDFPVVNGEYQLVGMLYEENILKPLFSELRKKCSDAPNYADFELLVYGGELSAIRAEQMMTTGEASVTMDLDIVRAGAIMTARRVRHLAVTANNRVVGMISDSAIFLHLMRVAHDKPGRPHETPQQTNENVLPRPAVKKMPQTGERRKFKRLTTTIQVAYKLADGQGKTLHVAGRLCYCRDVSLGGMLLEAEESLPLKHLIVLAFEIPGSKVPIRRLARVNRVSPSAAEGRYAVGVMFLALSVEETRAMRQLLKTLGMNE